MKIFKISILVFSMFLASQVSAQDADKKTKRAKNKFKKINTDGNEFISVKEWKDFYKDKKTKKGKPVNGDFLFLGYDINDDKKITLKELAKSRRKALKKR